MQCSARGLVRGMLSKAESVDLLGIGAGQGRKQVRESTQERLKVGVPVYRNLEKIPNVKRGEGKVDHKRAAIYERSSQ